MFLKGPEALAAEGATVTSQKAQELVDEEEYGEEDYVDEADYLREAREEMQAEEDERECIYSRLMNCVIPLTICSSYPY